MEGEAKTKRAQQKKNFNQKKDVADSTPKDMGSLRPDGTRRKSLKVKPGYVPPEEIPPYECPAIKERKSHDKEVQIKQGTKIGKPTNEPQTQAKKVQPTNKNQKITSEKVKKPEVHFAHPAKVSTSKDVDSKHSVSEAELAKIRALRSIKKKLRSIRHIEAKLEKGEFVLPEQLSKVNTKDDLVKRLSEVKINAS